MEEQAYKELLAQLDREAMLALLLNLVRRRPELAGEIMLEAARVLPASAQAPTLKGGAAAPAPALGPAAIRKQVRTVLKDIAGMYRYDEPLDDDDAPVMELQAGIFPLIDIANASIVAGDGRGALPILEAITDALVNGWDTVEGIVYDAEELFEDLGRAWAETILITDLTPAERQAWIVRLEEWRQGGEECGVNGGLAAAVEAAEQGWEYPPLVRVLQGDINDSGAWEGEAPACAAALAQARLNVLERQERWQEAVYLAEAEKQHDRYLNLLIRLGRAKHAVDYGMKILTTADAALVLAKALSEHGEMGLAFRIAKHGLHLEGYRYPLAVWMRDTALATGDAEHALEAAMSAVQEHPHLEDYTRLQELASEDWPGMREKILAGLRKSEHFDTSGRVDIFLHEGLMQDALNTVRVSYNYDLIARVAEAATPTHPLQVIPICLGQAADIMDRGKADRYHHAVRWVERARDAYRVADQESEWQGYKAGLLAAHHRKYKLIPMLRNL